MRIARLKANSWVPPKGHNYQHLSQALYHLPDCGSDLSECSSLRPDLRAFWPANKTRTLRASRCFRGRQRKRGLPPSAELRAQLLVPGTRRHHDMQIPHRSRLGVLVWLTTDIALLRIARRSNSHDKLSSKSRLARVKARGMMGPLVHSSPTLTSADPHAIVLHCLDEQKIGIGVPGLHSQISHPADNVPGQRSGIGCSCINT